MRLFTWCTSCRRWDCCPVFLSGGKILKGNILCNLNKKNYKDNHQGIIRKNYKWKLITVTALTDSSIVGLVPTTMIRLHERIIYIWL